MRVYVGTYGKYSAGNLFGQWLNIADFSDSDEFHTACAALHSDESDPEYMYQDWEDIPKGLIGESHINEKVFELAQMSDDDREMFEAYQSNFFDPQEFDDARDNFRGKYDSGKDFAMEFAHESGLMSDDHPMFGYVDWEHYWNSDLSQSFFEANGYFFHSV